MLIELDYPVPRSIELEAAKTLLLIIDMETKTRIQTDRFSSANRLRKLSQRLQNCEREFGRLAGELYILSPFALAMHLNLPCSKIPYANSKALGQLNGLMN